MGLAQAKKRAKLSHDPQNTHWARDTSGYGHKLLLSQGWQPGDTLGAQSAAHKEHFTQASSSHIRAVLREDNLGLGAKVGSGQAAGQCTGLDAFQNLLGRLNGKSEENIAQESEARQQYTRNSFAEQKYGMKFVKAGLLHGEKEFGLDEAVRVKAELEKIARMVIKTEEADQKPDAKVKLEAMDDMISTEDAKSLKREKKLKKREKGLKEEHIKTEPSSDNEVASAASLDAMSDIAAKKARKEARRARRAAEEASPSTVKVKEEEDKDDALDRKARRRAEKAAKKAREILPDPEIKIEVSDFPPEVVISQEETVAEPVRIVAPLGRANSVRSRYIRQKRLAVMDPQALKEIFMVKG